MQARVNRQATYTAEACIHGRTRSHIYLTSCIYGLLLPISRLPRCSLLVCGLSVMASAVGIPEAHPVTIASQENEPLLPQADDVIQKQEEKIAHNFITGESQVLSALNLDHIF